MKLNLDIFEGPLDLLLYLIKKNNLEISRVSIAKIAQQYLTYLETIKDLNVDVASEFLLMAAELAHLKSKALLPAEEENQEGDDETMGADALVAKLRLYQHYKHLAERLNERCILGRDVFKRGSLNWSEEELFPIETGELPPQNLELEVSAYDLVKAFGDMVKRAPSVKREHNISMERVSVTERIYEILDELRRVEHILFADLFEGHAEKIEYVVTFLAVLEMAKLKMTHVFQTETFGPIRLKRRLEEVTEEGVPSVVVNEDGKGEIEPC